jgi:hypothetical protein
MNKTFPVYSLLLSIALYGSCSEPLMDYDINTETPVVESYLLEGANSLTVKVYNMEVYLKDEYKLSKPIGELTVSVNDRELSETSSGVYQLEFENDTLREGQVYNLHFEHNGKSIEASTTVPAPVLNLRVEPEYLTLPSYSYYWSFSEDTAEVVISWDDIEDSYYQVYIESPNTSDMPSAGIFGRRMTQPSRGNSYRATARDFRTTGAHWIYVYRVNKDYVELYERIGASDLANPVSFVQNAFGIFTSMSAARVRVWVNESE